MEWWAGLAKVSPPCLLRAVPSGSSTGRHTAHLTLRQGASALRAPEKPPRPRSRGRTAVAAPGVRVVAPESALAAVAGLERGDFQCGSTGGSGTRVRWQRGREEAGEAMFQEAGRVVDGGGVWWQARGEGAGDLVGGGGAFQPGIDCGREVVHIAGGEQEPRIGQAQPGQELAGRALRWRRLDMPFWLYEGRCGRCLGGVGSGPLRTIDVTVAAGARIGLRAHRRRCATGPVVEERTRGDAATAEGDTAALQVPRRLEFVERPANRRLPSRKRSVSDLTVTEAPSGSDWMWTPNPIATADSRGCWAR